MVRSLPLYRKSCVTIVSWSDFEFPYFSASQILNYGPTYSASTHGMLDVMRGEGHDGLVLKGTATVRFLCSVYMHVAVLTPCAAD